jgi:hypothetical protein
LRALGFPGVRTMAVRGAGLTPAGGRTAVKAWDGMSVPIICFGNRYQSLENGASGAPDSRKSHHWRACLTSNWRGVQMTAVDWEWTSHAGSRTRKCNPRADENMCQVGMPLCVVAPGWSFYGDNNNCTFGCGRREAENCLDLIQHVTT